MLVLANAIRKSHCCQIFLLVVFDTDNETSIKSQLKILQGFIMKF